MGSNELESLRCLLQLLCWTKFHNPKRNTCDNTKHYRSLWTKTIEFENCPTLCAHNFLIKTPNDERFKSKFIILNRYTKSMLGKNPFGVCKIMKIGFEV